MDWVISSFVEFLFFVSRSVTTASKNMIRNSEFCGWRVQIFIQTLSKSVLSLLFSGAVTTFAPHTATQRHTTAPTTTKVPDGDSCRRATHLSALPNCPRSSPTFPMWWNYSTAGWSERDLKRLSVDEKQGKEKHLFTTVLFFSSQVWWTLASDFLLKPNGLKEQTEKTARNKLHFSTMWKYSLIFFFKSFFLSSFFKLYLLHIHNF